MSAAGDVVCLASSPAISISMCFVYWTGVVFFVWNVIVDVDEYIIDLHNE